MRNPDNTTNATFDDLFNRLLSTVSEERDIRTNGGTVTTLIGVRDRLQALRSDLAAVRNHLITETTEGLSNPQRPRYAIWQHPNHQQRKPMYIYPHIAAELHKYRTAEIEKAAEQTRLTANNAPKTRLYDSWSYTMTLVKKMKPHIQPLTQQHTEHRSC